MLAEPSVELDARLKISGDQLSGEISLPDGRTIAFEGWLGLIGAVESALVPARPDERD
jgi:hypothetical protein